MEIALVLLGRYPTDKAYGITTSATIECLKLLGHQVTVYAFDSIAVSKDESQYKRKLFKENYHLKFIRKQFSKNNKLLNQFYWGLYVHLYLRWVKKECSKDEYQLVWMRNFETYKDLCLLQTSFLLELHSIPKFKQVRFLKRNNNNLLLAPISKKINDSVAQINVPLVYAPMGIHDYLLASDLDIDNYLQNLRKKEYLEIVYVGKLFPGGISKGVETLISIAQCAKNNAYKIKIKIIGGNETETAQFRQMIVRGDVDSYFDLKGQLPHKIALRELKSSDIVILTKSSDANYAGFPLKAVEALASGKITIVEESDSYKDVFNDGSFVIWFNKNMINDVFLQIKNTIYENELNLKLRKNVSKARELTWINRTQKLLSKLS